MSTEQQLNQRSQSSCELCRNSDSLNIFHVPPDSDKSADQSILLCDTCKQQIESTDEIDPHHWHCLNDSMWSQTPAVQVMAWRMLTRLNGESWSRDLLDMLYLDNEILAWAKAGSENTAEEPAHKDSNGNSLLAGDTVTLIKDLNVKGTSFTAKRGTAVRGISLVSDNPEQIEGRVNGQQIVILTRFVKKST